jgi:DNA-binding transcriptional MerR regulator
MTFKREDNVVEQRLRPVDLARKHGLSPQAVRNYEAQGILPRAERTEHGYRVYRPLHAEALRAFLALVAAHGHQVAATIMRAANDGDTDAALTAIDKSHAQLLRDRQTLAAVEHALHDLTDTEPDTSSVPVPPNTRRTGDAGRETSPQPMFIGPLARQLGVRPATLRKWERVGIVTPGRDRRTGYRVYTAADIRDAHLAHQLRRGGYPLQRIAPLTAQVREAGGIAPLRATLDDWHARLTERGRNMLEAAAHFAAYLSARTDRLPAD